MRHSRILDKIGRGQPAFGVALHISRPEIYEMASLLGFDAAWLDLEHHSVAPEMAADLMRAARVGNMDVVARPANGEFAQVSRLLEAGATGIMYPRCASAEEAAEVVKWAKFAPLGCRGFDGSGADVPYLLRPMVEYLEEANQRTFVLIQIEDPAALECADAIAAVPGVDMLMLGPADFSILSGIPGQFDHPLVTSAIEKVAAAAAKAGKHWAATCGSVAAMQKYERMGARLLFHGCDLVYVKQGLEQVQQQLTQAFGGSAPETSVNGTSKSYPEMV